MNKIWKCQKFCYKRPLPPACSAKRAHTPVGGVGDFGKRGVKTREKRCFSDAVC